MITISFIFLVLAIRVESFICSTGQQSCGSSGCYDPLIQGCTNDAIFIQCINSCNGICYSNSQYCYNNTKVCNNGELVCDVKNYNSMLEFPLGVTCYNSSQLKCLTNTLCYPQYSCGTQCLNDYNSVCANNRTICYGFYFFSYYPYTNGYVGLCGPQQQCYDNTTNICLNGTTVCQGLNSQLCGTNCFNPDAQVCSNDNIQCINSCNGTCYSNSQYCYNNTKVCNNGELVCDVKNYNSMLEFPLGVTCYNSSQLKCLNNTLCYPQYSCGTQCLSDYYSVCANNRTICYGFYFFSYYPYTNIYVDLCGPQQMCYDPTTSICLGNNGTVCPIGNQLCSGVCCNPQTQYCVCGNNTIYCLNNLSSSNCLLTSTERPNSISSIGMATSTERPNSISSIGMATSTERPHSISSIGIATSSAFSRKILFDGSFFCFFSIFSAFSEV